MLKFILNRFPFIRSRRDSKALYDIGRRLVQIEAKLDAMNELLNRDDRLDEANAELQEQAIIHGDHRDSNLLLAS